ncbi:hypothetical protein Tco_1070040 [Tanacetum coccineum]|uniref:Reverse transcriptase Ty1/copia-type domain-containing protein n=1 Tax=Tanacetum coccineum TaxID=301880 RepID=A0ABQ5HK83_9ASTR
MVSSFSVEESKGETSGPRTSTNDFCAKQYRTSNYFLYSQTQDRSAARNKTQTTADVPLAKKTATGHIENAQYVHLPQHKLDEYGDCLEEQRLRLVAKGYRQEAGIDFEESFAPHTREVLFSGSAQFLTWTSRTWLAGPSKSRKVLCHLHYKRLNNIALSGCCAQIPLDAFSTSRLRRSKHIDTRPPTSSKSEVERKVVELYSVEQHSSQTAALIFTKALPMRMTASQHYLSHWQELNKCTPETLKELQDESSPSNQCFHMSKGRTVADSIAERLTRPTAYKFKTDCSIIPVWGLIIQDEGSIVPVESHHTPTGASSTSQPHLSPTLRSSIKQETEVPQPSSPPHTNVADEAATTVTSLEAGQGSDRVAALEIDLQQTKKFYGAAFTKLIKKVKRLEKKDKLSKSRRKLRRVLLHEEGSDSDILAQEDPSKQGRKISQINEYEGITLVHMGVSTASTDFTTTNVSVIIASTEISTSSPEVKNAGVSVDDIAAKSLMYIRRSEAKTKDKGKGIMEESESAMTKTKGNKNKKDLVSKIAAGSSKRNAEEELGQESSKRQKIGESSQQAKQPDELSQEELHQLMIIVLEEGIIIEALQTKYPIIDWEVYTEDSRMYWKIIRVGNHTEVYQVLEDMLKTFDSDDLVKLWSLVRERFNSTEPTEDKEIEIWVELKRLFEPDVDDELWKS